LFILFAELARQNFPAIFLFQLPFSKKIVLHFLGQYFSHFTNAAWQNFPAFFLTAFSNKICTALPGPIFFPFCYKTA
jgi:hypothetical protein